MAPVTDSVFLLFQETPNSVFLVMEVSIETWLCGYFMSRDFYPLLMCCHSCWEKFRFQCNWCSLKQWVTLQHFSLLKVTSMIKKWLWMYPLEKSTRIHHGVMVYAQHLLSACVLPFLAGLTAVIPPPCRSFLSFFFSLTLSKFPVLACWQPHPWHRVQLSPFILQHSAGCRVEKKPWLHLKLLTENTQLRFLGIMFPESLCFKVLFMVYV